MFKFNASGHQSRFDVPIRERGPAITGHRLVLLLPLEVAAWGAPVSTFSVLLDARTDVSARQMSISLLLIGNGHLIWLLVIVPFLVVV